MSEEQLTRTFTAMRRKFLHIATLFLPQKEDAEDALQDAFVKLWSRRDNINSDKEAEALTTTTVKNICIDKLRKQKIDTVPIDEEHDDSPEENNEERETLLQEVEAIINKELTPQQQKIISAREYDGKSIEEIASDLNMQPAAVRRQLSRARNKIREIYKQREQ